MGIKERSLFMKPWKRTFKCRCQKDETTTLVVKQFESTNKEPVKTTENLWD
jgi:hypothetical protein